MARVISLYDTTLRDGAQSDGVDFSVRDKVSITQRLDRFGMDYIEGGWPGANSVDTAYFAAMAEVELKHAKLAAFGCTHHARMNTAEDGTMKALAACCAPVVTIFGKTCPRHVALALGITEEKNLAIIGESVGFLHACKEQVIYDAEHFFDAYKRNAPYALATLGEAWRNGAHTLVLCDTNGGTMPEEVAEIVRAVQAAYPEASLGIHAHNDCGLAVANSLAAVEAGATMVQGTINGIGERCGNANLCTIIPNLLLKKGGRFESTITPGMLATLHDLSYAVCDIANVAPFRRQPYVGDAAFAHKGGVHVSAINKDSALYEHVSPESVGNARRILMSAQGGKSNILALARRLGIELDARSPALTEISAVVKENAARGYDYGAAEASVELLLRRHLGTVPDFFTIKRFYVINCKTEKDPEMAIEACLKVDINGQTAHTAASGLGPVDALERALRHALLPFYPELDRLSLVDYKVRVLTDAGSSSCEVGPGSVRVLIDSADESGSWTTVGVSPDLIEASWQALVDAFVYFLFKERKA